MSLSTSIFLWEGHIGTISPDDLTKACGGTLYECIEVRSDKTGTKMVFQRDTSESDLIYRSKPDGKFTILGFPWRFESIKDIKGKRFVVTGTLALSREEVQDMILQNGGEYSNQINCKTSYLITGKDPGQTKLNQAKALKIPTLNGQKFMQLFGY